MICILPTEQQEKELKNKKRDFMLNDFWFNRLKSEAFSKNISFSEMLRIIILNYFENKENKKDE